MVRHKDHLCCCFAVVTGFVEVVPDPPEMKRQNKMVEGHCSVGTAVQVVQGSNIAVLETEVVHFHSRHHTGLVGLGEELLRKYMLADHMLAVEDETLTLRAMIRNRASP